MTFVLKDEEAYYSELFLLSNGMQPTILSLAIVFTIAGLIQLPKLSLSLQKPLQLDVLLTNVNLYGVIVYAVCGKISSIVFPKWFVLTAIKFIWVGLIVGGANLSDHRHVIVFVSNGLLLVQTTLQGMFIAEASKRSCTSRYQILFKPGRQIVTFLLFANITLWVLDVFIPQNSWLIREMMIDNTSIDTGFLVHVGNLIDVSLHLTIVYRFHHSVMLAYAWRNAYRFGTQLYWLSFHTV